jgi:serine/threonine protein kinase
MQDGIYLITEFMDTDLTKLMKQTALNLTESHISWISFQILSGLKHMHGRGFVHGDIRPAHILVNGSCGVKIADFSVTRQVGQTLHFDINSSSQCSKTLWYSSPEAILSSSKEYVKASDIWSAGCILAELLLKKPLFQGTVGIDQLRKIFERLGAPTEQDIADLSSSNVNVSRVLELISSSTDFQAISSVQETFSSVSEDARDLLSKMLVLNPTRRISIDEALNHSFFSKINSSGLVSASTGNTPDIEQPQAADIEAQLRSEINKFRSQ